MSALGTFWALERAAVRREGLPREVEQVRRVNLALAFKLVELRERAGGERAGGTSADDGIAANRSARITSAPSASQLPISDGN